jgi:hypothetical protein
MDKNNGWTLREGDYQLLMPDDGTRALFEVESDPGGTTNLLESGSDAAETIAARLEARRIALRGSP